MFAGQVAAGELQIEVELLRRGRSATPVPTTVRNPGSPAGATTVAVFGATSPHPSFVDVAAPAVPAAADCPSYRDAPPAGIEPFPPRPFWDRVEGRPSRGHRPWDDYQPTTSEVATWLRFDDPPRLPDGSLDPLGVVTLADRMPGCVGERLGPRQPAWFAPSADLTVHLFAPLRSEWILAHDRARWAHDGWASADSTLWDEDGTLVAYATQMMLFTYLPALVHLWNHWGNRGSPRRYRCSSTRWIWRMSPSGVVVSDLERHQASAGGVDAGGPVG